MIQISILFLFLLINLILGIIKLYEDSGEGNLNLFAAFCTAISMWVIYTENY